ncbi:unnamed protein product [Vitrella brassicaformis CCMP3155]|uniref:Uncharacterized protein n=1 Tax=Vitrella brassicaformis (strain CCMP3155) TaxID=1169540 RepID=A0A0G4FAL5_VITBC|nr:unnamed protein product [Vitrella brassicaformis CCMP3155]|eukprot:CEM09936.1 unnamed protein product [Vitrella brassicaformis CCMP3155]
MGPTAIFCSAHRHGGDSDLDQQSGHATNGNDNNGDSPTTGLTGLFGNDNGVSGSAWGNNGQKNFFGNRRSGVGGQSMSTTRPSNERGIKIEIKKQMLDASIINSTTADAAGIGNATASPPPEAPDPAPPPLLSGSPLTTQTTTTTTPATPAAG